MPDRGFENGIGDSARELRIWSRCCVSAPARVPALALSALVPWLIGVVLTGCATSVENMATVFADPGKYEFHNCDQLTSAAKSLTTRAQELRTLIGRADSGAGGPVVGALAYRTDYFAVEEDLKVIEATARSKNCRTPSTWQSNTAIQ
jgi:hypothetical protein